MEVADGSPEWALGFEEECWWSRVALPTLSAYSEEGETRRMIQKSVAKGRSRAESRLLLRALPAQARRDLDKIRRWQTREFHNDAVP